MGCPSFLSRMARLAAAAILLVVVCVVLPEVSAAAAESAVGQRIVRVVIRGNQRVDANQILGQMRLREGGTYNPAILDEDLKRIYALGQFEPNLSIRPQEGPDGLTLVVEITERPVLEQLVFSGNRHFSDKDLQESVGTSVGSVIDRGKLFAAIRAIEKQYREAGYDFIHVSLDANLLAESHVARYTITEGPRVHISDIVFEGNASIPSSELLNQMDSHAYFPILYSGTFDQDQLARDMAAIRNYYIDQGFRDVRVDRALEFSDDKTRLVVRIVVDEGPRYHVRSVSLQGVDRFAPALMERQMALSPGVALTSDAVKHDLKLLQDTYGEVGFIDTFVEPIIDFTGEPGEVDVTLKVTEGRRVTIGEIRIEGNTRTKTSVVLRELGFYPEEPVNTKLIERAKRKLEGTGLFRPDSIEVVTLPSSDPDVVNMLVRVEETENINLILGAGISSDQGVIGNISLSHRNFDLTAFPKSADEFWRGESFRGAGQTLQLVLEPGTETQRYRIDFRDPHVADSPYSLATSLFYYSRKWETYDETRGGLNAGVGKELWPNTEGFVNLRLESIDITSISADAPTDVKKVAGSSMFSSIEVGLARDTTDSLLFPSEGYRLMGSIEQAGVLGGSYSFTKVTFDGRRYWTVTRDVLDRRSVLAVHGRVSQILGDAPIFERLYAGGQGSIRGFRYRGAGPHEGNTPIGGKFLVLASAEYSFPIYEKTLNGVVFIDTGTVERTISASTWRASVGFGVRFTVPFFGPVPFSLDFGIPIMKAKGDETEIISFSIGASF
jgi:outer membrane protein insertion porin family